MLGVVAIKPRNLVIHLREALANLGRGGLQKIMQGVNGRLIGEPVTRLHETRDFGSNPGNLRMMRYLPPALAEHPALVVVLHGCTQSAAGYDLGAGWSTLADRYGFALLLPEQQRSNNPNGCFNWFLPEHNRRGEGEAHSIRQMIERVIIEHSIDRSRVFITGLSAGGAMTSTMLACYPEVFAAGAIIAGLPYGAATNVKQAFQSMYQSPTRAAGDWGDLVRQASPHKGPWPRISVWHGSADKTVIPSNAREILKQWTDVHGLSLTQSVLETVDGYPREFWTDPTGLERIDPTPSPTWHMERRSQQKPTTARAARRVRSCCRLEFPPHTTSRNSSTLRAHPLGRAHRQHKSQ